jgi:Restriction endonuclease
MSRKQGNCGKRKSTTGKEFERIVASIHRQFDGQATITENELINGRQIDVSIRKIVAGYKNLIILECKDYKRKVEVGKVDELIGKMQAVKASQAILISDSGFTKGAIKRASEDGYVQLCSFIDSNNSNIKTKVHVGIQVETHDCILPQFKWTRLNNKGNDAVILTKSINEALLRYISLINENNYNLSSYRHVHSHEFECACHTFRLDITFTKIVKTFINPKCTLFGQGVFDHLKSVLSPNSNMYGTIDLENDPSWSEVPNGYVLRNKLDTIFKRSNVYTDKTAEDFTELVTVQSYFGITNAGASVPVR